MTSNGFAEKTRLFRKEDDTYYYEEPCSSCNNVGCSNCRPRDFEVLVPSARRQSFCAYPKKTFEYENPRYYQNCKDCPMDAPYFPGNFRKTWSIDPITGNMTYLQTDEGSCHEQTTVGPVQPTESVLLAPPVPNLPLLDFSYGPGAIAPGEQDNLAHRFVRNNRYDAQKMHDNVYIRPSEENTEPYTRSLYQTPYDSTKNVISTGKLINTYSGEEFETFENQLPPPNTNKGTMLKTQFEHMNPRLLHLTGGYNWHNPPPRKKEQCGSVFNPVSARGGASPFGSNIYDSEIRKQMELYASRDLYNNKDGDQVVEPSMYGEKPQGYVGLVPRNRIQPFLPATQELDTGGRMPIPQNLNPDLCKREEYTGEFFARKAKLLVTRAVAPNTLINGVEAVAQIPIVSDKLGRFGQCQTYITPAFVDGASYVHHEETRPSRIASGQTTRSGPANFQCEPTQQSIDTHFRGKLHPEMSIPLNAPAFISGDVIMSEVQNRPSGKDLAENSLPVLSANLPEAGWLVESDHNIRDTLKLATNEHNYVAIPNLAHTGDMVVSASTIRPSAKTGIVDASFQVPIFSREDFGQNVMPSMQTLRPSAKTGLVDASFQVPTSSREDFGQNVMPSMQTLRPSAKTGLVDASFQVPLSSREDFGQNVMPSMQTLRPSAKTGLVDASFQVPISGREDFGQNVMPSMQTLRLSAKTGMVDASFQVPISSREDFGQNVMPSMQVLRPSAKTGMVDASFQVPTSSREDFGQNVMPSMQTLRPSAKTGLVDAPFQVPTSSREDFGQNVMPSMQTLRPSAKTALADATFSHVVLSNEQLQTQLNLPGLQNLRASLKIALDEQRHAGGVDSGVIGGTVMDHLTVRETNKFNNETFPTAAIHSHSDGGVIVSEQTIRDTLKHEKVFRVNDPNLAHSGGILTSQANVRDTGKVGMVDQTHSAGPINLPDSGEILTSQANIRDTLRIQMENQYPSGAVDPTMPQGWVQLDKTVPFTERTTMPVFSHQPGPDGSRFGNELPLQLLTSSQHRGIQIQPYITQNKRVPDGIGGTSTRVIGQFQQLRPKTNTYFYLNPDLDFVQPKNTKLIPSVRLTQRALREAQDLAMLN
jgi:hypothetical protein